MRLLHLTIPAFLQEDSERAAFDALLETNDGLLKVEAARQLGKPLVGDPRAKEFQRGMQEDSSDSDDDGLTAPTMLAEDGETFTSLYDQEFNKAAVLEILARASAFCSVRMRHLAV